MANEGATAAGPVQQQVGQSKTGPQVAGSVGVIMRRDTASGQATARSSRLASYEHIRELKRHPTVAFVRWLRLAPLIAESGGLANWDKGAPQEVIDFVEELTPWHRRVAHPRRPLMPHNLTSKNL